MTTGRELGRNEPQDRFPLLGGLQSVEFATIS
jgi:hypothetical protein